VEETIQRVQQLHTDTTTIQDIHSLPPHQREAVGVTKRLSLRIASLHKNNDCPTCWLQRAHCICSQITPIDNDNPSNSDSDSDLGRERGLDLLPDNVNRIFLILHHKEIGLIVDTAKVILAAMPSTCRLIVNGIDNEMDGMDNDDDGSDNQYQLQPSMGELREALEQKERRCIVLFPTEDAKTFEELSETATSIGIGTDTDGEEMHGSGDETFDVVVIDGTWSQARKMHSRYIPLVENGGPARVCLSEESLRILGGGDDDDGGSNDEAEAGGESSSSSSSSSGRQLRRHPIKWREVSTLEATRLLLRDMNVSMSMQNNKNWNKMKVSPEGKACHDLLSEYQRIADTAARKQLGAIRTKPVAFI